MQQEGPNATINIFQTDGTIPAAMPADAHHGCVADRNTVGRPFDKLKEAEQLLRSVGGLAGNAGLLGDADSYKAQRQAFETARAASPDGLYQVKKAKEASRVQSRR